MVETLQVWLFLLIPLATFVFALWALIDAARYSTGTFPAAGKQTKLVWIIILIVATVAAFMSIPFPLGRGGGFNFLVFISIVAVGVYFAGVRPALRLHEPRRGGRSGSGSGSTGGW
jgi:Ca2+/H+ antiporter